jgi:hypothetical protein
MPEADAEKGAGLGALAGALGGLVLGLGVVTLPGIGSVVSAGWLFSMLAGSATGAVLGGAAGSLIGVLLQEGIDDPDAQVYAESLRRGGSLVVVHVEDRFVSAAESIMIRHRVDIAARRDELRAEGWTRFDDHAEPFLPPAKDGDKSARLSA